MADESDSNSSEKETVNYVRKKNIIPGIDNDHLIMLGLGLIGAAVAAPHVKNAIDGIINQYRNTNPALAQNQPRPPNGMQQQPVYLPPEPQPVQQPLPEQQQEQEQAQHQAFHEHEHAVAEQKAYEAALEKENVTGSQGISMVPDRSTQVTKPQKKSTYEAGSNISGSYS